MFEHWTSGLAFFIKVLCEEASCVSFSTLEYSVFLLLIACPNIGAGTAREVQGVAGARNRVAQERHQTPPGACLDAALLWLFWTLLDTFPCAQRMLSLSHALVLCRPLWRSTRRRSKRSAATLRPRRAAIATRLPLRPRRPPPLTRTSPRSPSRRRRRRRPRVRTERVSPPQAACAVALARTLRSRRSDTYMFSS